MIVENLLHSPLPNTKSFDLFSTHAVRKPNEIYDEQVQINKMSICHQNVISNEKTML